jgi:hypothetical protein
MGSSPDRPPVHDGKEVGMRRMIAAVAVATALLAMSVPASAAGPPTIIKFPKGTFDLGNLNQGPAGRVCPFPVGVVVKGGPGHAIFFDGQGVGYAGMGFGSFMLTITNLRTGESVDVNSSGPGSLDGNGVPVIGRGPWVIFEPIAEGGLRYFRGITRFVPAPYGVHGIPIAGIEEDLCDRVA